MPGLFSKPKVKDCLATSHVFWAHCFLRVSVFNGITVVWKKVKLYEKTIFNI